MLARTVVRLAETPAERDRVLSPAWTGGGSEVSVADGAESWLAGNYDDLVDWRRHIHRHPELGRQEFATTKFVAEKLADAGLNPRCCPVGRGLSATSDPSTGHASRCARTWMRCR